MQSTLYTSIVDPSLSLTLEVQLTATRLFHPPFTMSTTIPNGQLNSAQPITMYGHKRAPNPWKITLILEELDVPYSTKYLEFPDTKVEPFISLNPNGKLPAIWDPNHNVTLFEVSCVPNIQ